MLAKITLVGIETILNSLDRSLFDDIVIPQQLDKQTLIDSIFLKANEFPVIYTDYDYMHYMTLAFFKKYEDTFDRWAYTWDLEYNPIHNFDRHEEYSDMSKRKESGVYNKSDTFSSQKSESENDQGSEHRQGSTTDNMSGSENVSTNTTDQATNTTQANKGSVVSESSMGTDTQSNAVINDSSWHNYEKLDKTASGTTTGSENTSASENKDETIRATSDTRSSSQGTGTETDDITRGNNRTLSGSDTGINNGTGSDSREHEDELIHTGHLYGNIGVTRSQDMVKDELMLRVNFNLYELIAELYVKEFCVMVY